MLSYLSCFSISHANDFYPNGCLVAMKFIHTDDQYCTIRWNFANLVTALEANFVIFPTQINFSLRCTFLEQHFRRVQIANSQKTACEVMNWCKQTQKFIETAPTPSWLLTLSPVSTNTKLGVGTGLIFASLPRLDFRRSKKFLYHDRRIIYFLSHGTFTAGEFCSRLAFICWKGRNTIPTNRS